MEKAYEEFVDFAKKYQPTDTSVFAGCIGGELTHLTRSICHAGMHRLGKGCEYLFTGFRTSANREAELQFVHDLINYSVYSELFLSQDAEKVLEDCAFVMSTDHCPNFTMSAIIFTRQAWEYPQRVEFYHMLRQLGLGVQESLLMCVTLNYGKGLVGIERTTMMHTPLNHNMSCKSASNFLKGAKDSSGNTIRVGGGRYNNVNGIWGGSVTSPLWSKSKLFSLGKISSRYTFDKKYYYDFGSDQVDVDDFCNNALALLEDIL